MLIDELEQRLDSFNAAERKKTLTALCEMVRTSTTILPKPGTDVNLHCHTFFSYNSYGYSPSKFAWLARKAGFAVAGVVDFDVLDALGEFLQAARMLGLKACAGLESRVFVPEFATKVINSPGEPGIAYHVGTGFPTANLADNEQQFLDGLRQTAQQRNRELMERVNKYLTPIELDYEKDVLVLTPGGNPTERHICLAYARKARAVFEDDNDLSEFWTEKSGKEIVGMQLPESRELLDTIRAKTMKRGGVGYVRPCVESFPLMEDFNRFVLEAGGIPSLAWLDGTSKGEKEIEELLSVSMSTGTAAVTIIPDRNYKSGVKDRKLKNLYDFVELCESMDLPIFVGTEMNSPGQKFVDSFESEELAPLAGVFLKGAYIAYAHSVLQQEAGMGYTSCWASERFSSVRDKNKFFEEVGKTIRPRNTAALNRLAAAATAEEVMAKIKPEKGK